MAKAYYPAGSTVVTVGNVERLNNARTHHSLSMPPSQHWPSLLQGTPSHGSSLNLHLIGLHLIKKYIQQHFSVSGNNGAGPEFMRGLFPNTKTSSLLRWWTTYGSFTRACIARLQWNTSDNNNGCLQYRTKCVTTVFGVKDVPLLLNPYIIRICPRHGFHRKWCMHDGTSDTPSSFTEVPGVMRKLRLRQRDIWTPLTGNLTLVAGTWK